MPSGEKASAYHQFFADFLSRYNRQFPDQTIATTPGAKNWFGIGKVGQPGAGYNLSFTEDERFRVELTFQNTDKVFNKAAFDRLCEQKGAIEDEIGEPLTWDRLDNLKRSRIAVYYPGPARAADPEPLRTLYLEWAATMVDRFRRVLSPRVERLK
jgi:hypothetical protein